MFTVTLSKTSLEDADIARVIKSVGNLGQAMKSDEDEYRDALSQEKIPIFKEELERIKINST